MEAMLNNISTLNTTHHIQQSSKEKNYFTKPHEDRNDVDMMPLQNITTGRVGASPSARAMESSPSHLGPNIQSGPQPHPVKQEAQQLFEPQTSSQLKRKSHQITDSSSSGHLEDSSQPHSKINKLVMESSASIHSRGRDMKNNNNNSSNTNDNNSNQNNSNNSSLSWTTHHFQPQHQSQNIQDDKKERVMDASMPAPLIDLAGTTALDARSMTPLERQMVLLKRKLRNRESARRSRLKKQRNLLQLNDEYKELVQRTSGLCSFVGQLGRENNEMVEMNRRLKRAVEDLERKKNSGKD
mmetsp:Transcript_323/g.580  ORF Transcript_323/g.580 Transcript_323/m.580 type:complete len:297 (+) Transcript_323:25-915(+)